MVVATPLIPALLRQRQEEGDQPGLQREFQDSKGYTKKPYLEKQQQKLRVFICFGGGGGWVAGL